MITKEPIGYTMQVAIKSKQWEEQAEYKKNVKECSLCHCPINTKKNDSFGELGYIRNHSSCVESRLHYDYFFMVLCIPCFEATRDTMNKLRKEQAK